MSSHISSLPLAARRRGGTWRYAVPDTAGPGAAKFRENLRRLGGEDMVAVDTPGDPGLRGNTTTPGQASSGDSARRGDSGRPARPVR